jgi:hypothetical protein
MMTGRGQLTNLPAAELEIFMLECRVIAGLDREAALEAADSVLWRMLRQHGNGAASGDEGTLSEEIARLGRETDSLRRLLETPDAIQPWQPRHLRDQARELGLRFPAKVQEHVAEAATASTSRTTTARNSERDGAVGI